MRWLTHLDLHCLQRYLYCSVGMKGWVKLAILSLRKTEAILSDDSFTHVLSVSSCGKCTFHAWKKWWPTPQHICLVWLIGFFISISRSLQSWPPSGPDQTLCISPDLVRLSLLTITNPNQLCDVLLLVCSKMADETNLISKLPVVDRTREVWERKFCWWCLSSGFPLCTFLLGFADSFCFVFTRSPFYEASPLCMILCNLFPWLS